VTVPSFSPGYGELPGYGEFGGGEGGGLGGGGAGGSWEEEYIMYDTCQEWYAADPDWWKKVDHPMYAQCK